MAERQLQEHQQRERQWQRGNYKSINRGSASGREATTRASTEGAPMAERAYRRRPTASVTKEKRQRQKHAHHCPQVTRALGVSRQKHDPPRMSTNQIIAFPARARLPARASARLQGVYKASPVVSKPFGLGLARVRLM